MKTNTLTNIRIFFGLLVAGLLASIAAVASSSVIPSGFLPDDQVGSEISSVIVNPAAVPRFNLVKPSTTGVPGEEVRVMKVDPDGNLWIAGRFYFWSEGGVAKLPDKQLKFRSLPGGGFDRGSWQVWSNVQHPIPTVYINDMVFGADGVIWIASDGGLRGLDPAGGTQGQMGVTYDTIK